MAEVRADIAASVWKVNVKVGDAVTVGQPLVVLESMKMEIPVESPVDGTVTALHVEPSHRVTEGGLLVTLA